MKTKGMWCLDCTKIKLDDGLYGYIILEDNDEFGFITKRDGYGYKDQFTIPKEDGWNFKQYIELFINNYENGNLDLKEEE